MFIDEAAIEKTGIKIVTTDDSKSYTYSLKLNEQDVWIDTTDGVGTIYLPNVSEARGRTYNFIIIAGSNAATIADNDESADWSDLATMDAVYDRCSYRSDGRSWHQIETDIA